MRRGLAALIFAIALAGPSAASEIGMIERVASLVEDVCFVHGGDAEAVARMATERHWPTLTDETVERLDWVARPAYLAGWQVGDEDDPIALTIGWGEYHYLVGQTVWAFAPRDEREAVLLPDFGGTSVSCQLNFALENPSELYRRLAALDGLEEITPMSNLGVLTYEGAAPTIIWVHEDDAWVWFTYIPDPTSPRGVITISKPLVSAPTRRWPPLRLNAQQRLLRQGQRGP